MEVDARCPRSDVMDNMFKKVGMDLKDGYVDNNLTDFNDQTKALLRLLEIFYVGKFRSKMTMCECLNVSKLAFQLGLLQTATEIASICSNEFHRYRSRLELDFKFRSESCHQGLTKDQVDQMLSLQIRQTMNKIFNEQIIDFCTVCLNMENSYRNCVLGTNSFGPKENEISDSFTSNINILSPEEQRNKTSIRKIEHMRICMNLDEFYDVVFKINDYAS